MLLSISQYHHAFPRQARQPTCTLRFDAAAAHPRTKKGGLAGKARGQQGGGKPWPADPSRACARAALDRRWQIGPTLTLAAAYAASVFLRARCFSKPTSCLGLVKDGRLEGKGIASTNIARATSACVVYHSRSQMGNWRGWGVKSEVTAKNKAWHVTNTHVCVQCASHEGI
jgi:hypothetical protein